MILIDRTMPKSSLNIGETVHLTLHFPILMWMKTILGKFFSLFKRHVRFRVGLSENKIQRFFVLPRNSGLMIEYMFFLNIYVNSFFYWLYQVIAAEGEQKASRALRDAADVIAESPSALQVNKSKPSEMQQMK
jgi:hypothetical protein